mgnify:CR=1 FL=1
MRIEFFDVLITVFSLIILIIPGYLLVKIKMLPAKAGGVFSTLVLYVCQPMLVFMGFQKEPYSAEIGMNMLIVAGIAILIHTVVFALIYLLVRNKTQVEKMRCVRFASCFSNCGYMGIPFLEMLFTGSLQGTVIIYASVVISIFNILSWTVGVYMITGDKKSISIKKVLFNPVILSVVLGFLLFVILKQPIAVVADHIPQLDRIFEGFMSSFTYLSNMVTPLAMTVIGIRLANVNLKKLFLDKWAYFVCAFKLIIMSLVSILAVAFLPIDNLVKYVIFFTLSMPSATATTLFTEQFGGDSESASVYVLLSTVMSILIIPLMYMVFQAIAGV